MTAELAALLRDIVKNGAALDWDGKQPRLKGRTTPDLIRRCSLNRDDLIAWLRNPQPVTPFAAHAAFTLRALRLFPLSKVIR